MITQRSEVPGWSGRGKYRERDQFGDGAGHLSLSWVGFCTSRIEECGRIAGNIVRNGFCMLQLLLAFVYGGDFLKRSSL